MPQFLQKKGVNKNLLNQIQNILIVYEFNIAPINFLISVFFLLHFKNMLQHQCHTRWNVIWDN